MTEQDVAVIACDESASEGENLMGSYHPVFVHGSVNLTLSEAKEFIGSLRRATGTQAPEMKSKTVLAPRHRASLLAALPALVGRANINFVDKSYFITAKLIALLLAEQGERNGVDVHLSGLGRHLTDVLHRKGPTTIGHLRWQTLLTTFNNVIKSYVREGSTPPTVVPFFSALADARTACRDQQVSAILEETWEARHLTLEYAEQNSLDIRELDPMFPALTAVTMTWGMRLGDKPFEYLVDNYSGLTQSACADIVRAARVPLVVSGVPLPRGDLRDIRLIDSKLDERVQTADILAGAGREVARLAIAGTLDDDLQNAVHQMLDFNIMSSGGSPLDRLIERKPLTYVVDWVKAQGENRTARRP